MTTRGNLPSREAISNTMHAVVQIVALRQGMLGGLSPAWTGSGTIVHPSGIVLTNCHVANPRAMGMSAPPADRLGIAITERSDQPPVLTYFAQILVQSPDIDLALLKIVSGVDGRAVSNLKLPSVSLGDSDTLELGDTVSIFGYPGIGGETPSPAAAFPGLPRRKSCAWPGHGSRPTPRSPAGTAAVPLWTATAN